MAKTKLNNKQFSNQLNNWNSGNTYNLGEQSVDVVEGKARLYRSTIESNINKKPSLNSGTGGDSPWTCLNAKAV